MAWDAARLRDDFPALAREVRPGVPLVYLDSAATALIARPVLEAMADFETRHRANIHRGVHTLAEEATALYEQARADIAALIHAPDPREIIFTRNATEAINLVARTWGQANLKAGDTVLLTEMEHHANLVPWQMLAQEKGIHLEFIPVTGEYLLDLDAMQRLLETTRPKLVGVMQVSNVLGTVNPVREIIAAARAVGAVTLVDGAQAVPHMAVDVQAIGADFYAFSGHKMFGPTGIGVLWGRAQLLEAMPPFLGGGDMIRSVSLRSFKTNDIPYKFEAGTPAIAQAIGLGAAARYLQEIGMENVEAHSRALVDETINRLAAVPQVRLFGPGTGRQLASVSFTIDGLHPHDISQVLDTRGAAVRAGHHCAMPLHTRFGLPASTRASFSLYNQREEIDVLIQGILLAIDLFL
ncbi:MAG: SufS family cysteine desulfurase [Anaerolineae bacterium]|nr:SufS family cysteine desulfurase [Anaerolineae bacterium]